MKFNIILIFSLLYLSILQFFGNGPSSALATIIAPDNQLNNGIKIKKSFEGENAAIKIEKPKKPFSAQFGLRRKRQYAAVIDQPLPSKPKKNFLFEQLGLRKKRQYAEPAKKESLMDKALNKLGIN